MAKGYYPVLKIDAISDGIGIKNAFTPAMGPVYYAADGTIRSPDGNIISVQAHSKKVNAYTRTWSKKHQADIHQIRTPHIRGTREIKYNHGLDDSIRRIGVCEPITVVPDSGHLSRYVVINGNARLNSAAKHKLPFIPCIILTEKKMSVSDRVELMQSFQVIGCTYPDDDNEKIYHYKAPMGPVFEVGTKVLAPSTKENFFVLVTIAEIGVEPRYKKGWKYKWLLLGNDIKAWQHLCDKEEKKEKLLNTAEAKAEYTKARQQVEDLVGPEEMKLLTSE